MATVPPELPDFAWDVFISHASEDKDEVARPLAHLLQEAGLRVWYDEQSLKLGDSLNESIANGLRRSRYGLVILSPNFIKKKKWTAYEINALFSLEDADRRRILPVTHNLQQRDIVDFNPALADRVSVSTARGLAAVSHAVTALFEGRATTSASTPKRERASERVAELSRQLDILLQQLQAVGISATVQVPVLNEYRYSHHHLIDAATTGGEESLEKAEQHLQRAISDVFDILVLHLSEKLNDLLAVQGSLSVEDQATLELAQRRLAAYMESLLSVRMGRERVSGLKLAVTAGEALQVLSIVGNINSPPRKSQLAGRLVELAVEAAKRIIGYL